MSRELTGGMAGEIVKAELAPVVFIEGDFSGGYARMWNGVGPIVWDAKTWLGGGRLLSFGPVQETRAVEATRMSVALSGVDSSLVSVAYGDFSQGRSLIVWLGAMDQRTAQIVSDPVQVFAGRMDTISDSDDGSEAVITVTAESSLADLKRIRTRFLTDQDQQRFYPGDRALRYIPNLQDIPIFWGVEGNVPDLKPVSV